MLDVCVWEGGVAARVQGLRGEQKECPALQYTRPIMPPSPPPHVLQAKVQKEGSW